MCHNPYAAYQFAQRCADLAAETAIQEGTDAARAQRFITSWAADRAYRQWRASIAATGYVGPADDDTYRLEQL